MLQILVSLGILALWALTSLLSRETQPLPVRPARPQPNGGPRPTPIKFSEADPRTAARSLSSSSVAPSQSGAAARGSKSPVRRGVRTRSTSGPAAAKTAEPGQARRLSSQINQSMAQAVNRPLEITPLEIPLSSLSSTLMPLGSRAALGPSSFQAVAPALDAKTARAIFRSPEKLREIAILSELLRPPLAMRPRRRSH
jgi:hypothetical protein